VINGKGTTLTVATVSECEQLL